MASAIVATVERSKRLRSGKSTPNTSRTRDTTLIASNECPPISKKSSFTPTLGTLSKLGPKRRERALGIGTRRDGPARGTRLVSGHERQCLAVDLAVGIQRQRLQQDERGGNHVMR